MCACGRSSSCLCELHTESGNDRPMTARSAALGKLRETAWKTAVTVRPHYPPCDFPDHACACGAAEDRLKIAEALLTESSKYRALREAVNELTTRLEQDAKTGEYAGGHYAHDVLIDVVERI